MTISLKIGVVEDNDDLCESLVELLTSYGHLVTGFSCAEDFTDNFNGIIFDLLVMDLNLPGEDGLSLSQRLKKIHPRLRILMMTTRTALKDRVIGYARGADLYLPKPIAKEELVAAIDALGRQIDNEMLINSSTPTCSVCIDLKALELIGPLGMTPLAPREITLLTALAQASGQQLEYWQLLQILNVSEEGFSRSMLAVIVTRIRNKFQQVGCPGEPLKALRSYGYQLCQTIQIR
jgi:DNA-binding response OmpR family regulator